MASENETVYAKYKILDAKTGAEKHGKYFVLKIDAADPEERNAVSAALSTYAKCQAEVGRKSYAEEVMRYAEVSKNETVEAVIAEAKGIIDAIEKNCDGHRSTWHDMFDRIESAWRREKAKLERKVHEHHFAFLAEKARHTETYKDERIRAQDAEIATLKIELTELRKCMKEVLDDYVCKGGASFENGCEGCVDTIGCRLPRWRKALEGANAPIAEGGES